MKLERTATGIRLTLGTTVREVTIPSPAHIAIVRQGSDWFIWVNGSLADSFTTNYPVPQRAATIGPVDTVLDEIRLTGAALYTAPFTPPETSHQAWYQGNLIFAKGQVTQGLNVIEGQIGGSKGSITEGSVLPNAQVGGSEGSITEGSVFQNGQVGGSKGSITEGSVLPNAQVAGSKGFITDGSVFPNAQVVGSKGVTTEGSVFPNGQTGGTKGSTTEGSVLPNGQVEGSKGSIAEGSVLPNGQVGGFKGQITQGQIAQEPPVIEGQIAGTKGFLAEGSVLPNGQVGGSKGQILQGDPAAPPLAVPGQNAGTKGFVTDGEVIIFGIYSGQSQFTKGAILQGRRLVLGDRWSKGFVIQGTAPTLPPFLPPPTGAIPSQQQYAKGISPVTAQGQQTAGWTARFLQKEEGQVVPAVSLGGDLAVTPEGQQLRGRLLPMQDPDPGTPLLVTGSPGNYLLDTLSWDPSRSSAYSLSAYSPPIQDSRRGRCGTCVTLEDLRAGTREGQRWAYFTDSLITQEGAVELARFVSGGLQSVKVESLGIHWLFFGIYGRDQCLQRDRQTGFWASGKFAVPFPAPTSAVTRAFIVRDDDNVWYDPGWFQGNPITIPIAGDGRWQVAWQENPRRPSTGSVEEIPGSSNSINIGTYRLGFQFPFEADLATLVELEICFGNAGVRRAANE